jgi:hypothetical protein
VILRAVGMPPVGIDHHQTDFVRSAEQTQETIVLAVDQ